MFAGTLASRVPLSCGRSNEVFRRTYGKDNRVLRTANLSQGFKVGPLSRTWQGAGLSTGSTKIGVTCSETRMGETEIEQGGAMTPSNEETCGVVVARPASSFRSSTGGPEVFYENHSRRAGNRQLMLRMRNTKLTLPDVDSR